MNILVAEKDRTVLSKIIDLIRGWGYRAESSENGRETLHRAGDEVFDLILLDTSLPDMAATELIVKLKELQPEAGIVTMTASNPNGLENEIRTLGIVYYMLKPISQKILKEILDHRSKKKKASEPKVDVTLART